MTTPRVLFVARTRYALPLSVTLQRRFDALSAVIDWRQFATSSTGKGVSDERFTLVGRFPVARLDGAAFYSALPVRLAREIRAYRPEVLIVQGAEDTALALAGRRLARSNVPLVFDVHGDWRNNTRVYGSPGRRVLAPVADALARLTLRHADAVRTVSGFTSELVREQGVEPIATFPAYMDLAPFLDVPPVGFPARPAALFVGVLEKYKAVDVLADAWLRVVAQRPGAELHIVGAGRLEETVRSLVADPSLGVRWSERLDTAGVARALDAATLLVLPSRREGMGRVIVEAFCRGRPVVGTDSGGIPDLVEDGVNGLLVPTDDAAALAAALGRVMDDSALARRLGAGATASSTAWAATPEEFALRVRELVDAVLSRPGS
ncbi:MAG: glycosyltransferase family 1 protein, partial [Thermoleophilia bacterium]|nr:glycosyltransferase family 1 protein [Thermoleophilia bacterium]